MEQQEIIEQSILIGPSLLRKGHAILGIIEEQISLLNSGVNYSRAQEFELNDSLLWYVNSSIGYFAKIRKAISGFNPTENLAHFLLREYRNVNQHGRESFFRPTWHKRDRIDFFIWPYICRIDDIKKRYPHIDKNPTTASLSELVKSHQGLLLRVIKELTSGIDFESVKKRLRIDEFHSGKNEPLELSDFFEALDPQKTN